MVKKIIWRKTADKSFDRIVFYRVDGKTLIISYFFDTRQDPSKRPF